MQMRERGLGRRRKRRRGDPQAEAAPQAEIAVAIEEPKPAPASQPEPDSAEDLVQRLGAIKQRLFWLATVYATSLSHDVAYEADNYRRVFRELGEIGRASCRERVYL